MDENEYARKWVRYGFEGEFDRELGVNVPRTDRLGSRHCERENGSFCPYGRLAGQGTDHEGVGRCSRCGGKTKKANREGALMMGHVIAAQVQMSPWEALLLAVRRTATWAAFYDFKMSQVEDGNDDALRPGGTHYDWVLAAERVNGQMARYAKMAVDAGVSAMLVSQAKNDGMAIARVVNQALGEAGLDEESDRRIREALRRALMEIDAQRHTALPS